MTDGRIWSASSWSAKVAIGISSSRSREREGGVRIGEGKLVLGDGGGATGGRVDYVGDFGEAFYAEGVVVVAMGVGQFDEAATEFVDLVGVLPDVVTQIFGLDERHVDLEPLVLSGERPSDAHSSVEFQDVEVTACAAIDVVEVALRLFRLVRSPRAEAEIVLNLQRFDFKVLLLRSLEQSCERFGGLLDASL